jgi:hypothetical protein
VNGLHVCRRQLHVIATVQPHGGESFLLAEKNVYSYRARMHSICFTQDHSNQNDILANLQEEQLC